MSWCVVVCPNIAIRLGKVCILVKPQGNCEVDFLCWSWVIYLLKWATHSETRTFHSFCNVSALGLKYLCVVLCNAKCSRKRSWKWCVKHQSQTTSTTDKTWRSEFLFTWILSQHQPLHQAWLGIHLVHRFDQMLITSPEEALEALLWWKLRWGTPSKHAEDFDHSVLQTKSIWG